MPLLPRTLATLAGVALAAAPLAAQHLPGHVLDHRFIGESLGGFTGTLADGDSFGHAVCVVGDVNGDGVDDIAVSAPNVEAPAGVGATGRVWILFMDANGEVIVNKPIDAEQGAFPFTLDAGDYFGSSIAPAGDLNGDGVPDLWVGARGDDDGAAYFSYKGPGALYAVMLTPDGKVDKALKHSMLSGLALDLEGGFGSAVADVGDLDGNGFGDLVVGAPFTDSPGNSRGAYWVLHMKGGGKIDSATLVSPANEPRFAALSDYAYFGSSVAGLGDIDGNGTPDYAVGAPNDEVLAPGDGSVWFVRTQGTSDIKSVTRFAADTAGFQGNGPETLNYFGRSLANLGDLDLDGRIDVAVGASNGGDSMEGTVWVLRCGGSSANIITGVARLDGDEGFVPFALASYDFFGFGLAPAGDLNGDGTPDMLAGLPGHDGGGTNAGALALLALRGPTFVDLGGEVGGVTPPALGATGTLVGGKEFTVQLKNGPSFGAATAVLGFTAIHAPFKGGVMVPAPDLLLSSFPLDGIGFLSVTAPLSEGIPLGVELYLQLWVPDASLPLGFAGSNALKFIAGA